MSPNKYLHMPTRPSPLAQVHHTRPLSQAPQVQGLIRDPLFWKRFSTAVHMDEAGIDDGGEKAGRPGDLENQRRNTGSSTSSEGSVKRKERDDWMAQQRREKNRCRTICIIITMVVIVLIAGASFAGWYFTNINPIHITM